MNAPHVICIAEIGLNHGGCLQKACRLIWHAKKSGFNAVKFQIYKTKKRFSGNNKRIIKILKKCELSEKSLIKIKKYCDKLKILFFATVFDEDDAKMLKKLNCNLCKISSFDIVNKKLLKKLAKYQFKFFISTGMATTNDIKNAKKIFKQNKKEAVFFHCVSNYPNDEKNVNLKNINYLRKITRYAVGFSDHTQDIFAPVLAVGFGAKYIEKHFMLSNDHRCVDACVSVTPKSAKHMIALIRRAEKMIGDKKLAILPCERPALIFRRKTI